MREQEIAARAYKQGREYERQRFKEQIEKMEVLSDEEMDEAYCLADLHTDKFGHKAIAQAQLAKDKDALRGCE